MKTSLLALAVGSSASLVAVLRLASIQWGSAAGPNVSAACAYAQSAYDEDAATAAAQNVTSDDAQKLNGQGGTTTCANPSVVTTHLVRTACVCCLAWAKLERGPRAARA